VIEPGEGAMTSKQNSWFAEFVVALVLAALTLVAFTMLAGMPTRGVSATATVDPAIFQHDLPLVY